MTIGLTLFTVTVVMSPWRPPSLSMITPVTVGVLGPSEKLHEVLLLVELDAYVAPASESPVQLNA